MSIREKVQAAISELFTADIQLFKVNAAEPAITAQFGRHLQGQFPEWHVDCEYNRNHDIVKRLSYEKNGHFDDHQVIPDIIVHRRSTDQNILVVEVKKSTNPESDESDLNKIQAFHEQLGYQAALFIRFITGQEEPGIIREIWLGQMDEEL